MFFLLAMVAVIAVTLYMQLLLNGSELYLMSQYYINFPCIFLLLIITVPIVMASGLIQDLGNAFRYVIIKECEVTLHTLKRAKEAVTLTMKILLYGGGFIAVFYLISMLHTLIDTQAIGPNIASALISLLYALIGNIILLGVKARLNIKIIEYVEADKEND